MAQHPTDTSSSGAQFEGSRPSTLPLSPSEDRQWAMISHFGAILGCIPSAIIFMLYRYRGPFTAQESREAFNFTFPLTILAILTNILSMIPVIGWAFALITVALWVYMTITGAIGGVQAGRGQPHRYKFNLRLMK